MSTIHRFAPVLFLLAACAEVPTEEEEMKLSESAATVAPPPMFVEKAVNVDRRFSDVVKVREDALVIPSSLRGKIEVGSIVAGDRASSGANNPYGFLRRVTKIEAKGNETILSTEKAQLSDWIYAGRVDFDSTRSLFDGGKAPDVKTLTLHLQDTTEKGDAKGEAPMTSKIGSSFSIENATLTMNAKFDGYFEVARKELKYLPDPPERIRFRSHLVMDPRVVADLRAEVKATAAKDETWIGPSVAIPIGGPIPITLRFAPSAKCHVSADGTFGWTVGANLGAHVDVGFEGTASLSSFDLVNLSQAPSLDAKLTPKGFDGKATVSTGCTLAAEPELLLFDSVGISGKVGPFVDVTTTLCAEGAGVKEEHGVEETISGHIQIPVLAKGKDFDLKSFKQSAGSNRLSTICKFN